MNVAVILSGCGVFDGAEINETVLTLLALEEQGCDYTCFSLDKPQNHTINHHSGEMEETERNILEESARIVRGNIKSLSEIDVNDFSALIVPGGFGVAKNFSSIASDGKNFIIDPEIEKVLRSFSAAKKPVGYMCISPVLLPKFYHGVRCTIGNDLDTANIINELGGQHVDCAVEDIVIDEEHKVVSTPAYMLASNMVEAKRGIDKLVSAVIAMV
ncbi:isoprenoid biosynthesis glyoxalase ElbB [Vibrio sagamiensis]|uniref:Glyoxalase n=1 Tax=Vibrio sagamiensis NBRC 104589 TaxID=1219064 RepID=A0A511QJC5_9VIBR|nr:isoprenoid biosynthesis glyoxalase ElbB [Vibrio sagamiensis]PNQ70580.1 isoprenoid biosynthesis protein ElbB [Vibrio agarivorans]GEM77424.1 glyoxalase [Vibrio sagamiensis NBRC 104589]